MESIPYSLLKHKNSFLNVCNSYTHAASLIKGI